jgi:60 kDa SS-A/Ro ribonucleoprotein
MSQYTRHFQRNQTPQTEQAKPEQVKNNAGGFVFQVSSWTQLDRFLILGCEGPTYYATEQKMTRDNAKNVLACLQENGCKTVLRIQEILQSGRAPKNDAAIFALALAATDESETTRAAAYAALPAVCRIGTHLFQFLSSYAALHNGKLGGSGLQKAISRWYTTKSPDDLAMQVLKYQNREAWSHRDALRIAHGRGIKELSKQHAAIFEWVRTKGEGGFEARTVTHKTSHKTTVEVGYSEAADRSKLPRILDAYAEMKAVTTKEGRVISLIENFGFTREMVPTHHLNSPEVWEALLHSGKYGMPMTAMIRNLGKMTAVGLIKPLSAASKFIASRICDASALKHARVHPIQMLSALRIYTQGHGEKGKLSWTPDRAIIDGLDEGFYGAFQTVEPTGQNTLLALDISVSMGGREIAGVPGLTPRDASAVMAMVTARAEKNWFCHGFGQTFVPLKISPKQRLTDVIRAISDLPFQGTDCALPMLYASGENLDVDVFTVMTDNETWHGKIHPFQALRAYRAKLGKPDAKLIVVGVTATEFSIADPSDPGMLDMVGLDSVGPQIMADFARSSTLPG